MLNPEQIIIRLIIGTLLGGIIGIEREINNRPAGLRTHVLVTLGSTIFMLISVDGFNYIGLGERIGDPFRIAAQVVSGIGFLGAGTIMKTDNNIQGLTTAASLWVSAGIGLSIGIGYYVAGITTTIIVLITLMSLRVYEVKMFKEKYRSIEIISEDRPGIVGEIGTFLGKHRVKIKELEILEVPVSEEEVKLRLSFLVKLPIQFEPVSFSKGIAELDGIYDVILEGIKLEEYKYSKKRDIKDRE